MAEIPTVFLSKHSICQQCLAKKGSWLHYQFQNLFLLGKSVWAIKLKTWAKSQLFTGNNYYSWDKKKADTENLRNKCNHFHSGSNNWTNFVFTLKLGGMEKTFFFFIINLKSKFKFQHAHVTCLFQGPSFRNKETQ